MTDWLQPPYTPFVIDDLVLAFPADVRNLMPDPEMIPSEFGGMHGPWNDIAHEWFYRGLSDKTEFHCKGGIDGRTAFRHLSAILGSFQPKHEHKMAAVAFLMSEWFTKVTKWKRSDKESSGASGVR